MEPIRLWRANVGTEWRDVEPHPLTPAQPGVWLPRADFDALVKERDDWRDTSMAAYAAAHGLDWRSLTKEQLDAMEADGKANGDKKAMDVVRRLYAKWNAAVYDADKVRTERDLAEREWQAATARADKAEALLSRVRVATRHRDQNTCDVPHALSREIDAHLAAKGQTAPTPADPKNHAPAAASADGCTEQKEP